MKNKKTPQLTFGLYTISPRYPISWLRHTVKDTIILGRRIKFLLKHGYNEPAQWETFEYFIDMFEEILENYRYHRNGTQVVIPAKEIDTKGWEERNEKAYDDILDTMLFHLREMREKEDYESLASEEIRKQTHCNEFFKLFAERFYGLWD